MTVAGSYTVQWGPLRLYVADIDTEVGRDQVTHMPARGDSFVLQDRGLRHRVVRCTLVFGDVATEPKSWQERWADFRNQVAAGDEHVFVHPLHGSFMATVGSVGESYSADADMVRASVEFLPSEPYEPVSNVGAGIIPVAGPEAVAIAASEVTVAAAEAGFTVESTLVALPDSATELAESWEDAGDDMDPRRVVLEVNSKVAEIDALIAEAELFDLQFWDVYRSLMVLRDRLVTTAEAFTSETRNTFQYRNDAAVAGLTLCARLYGALLAATRWSQVRAMNPRLVGPIVPAGITLTMPAEAP